MHLSGIRYVNPVTLTFDIKSAVTRNTSHVSVKLGFLGAFVLESRLVTLYGTDGRTDGNTAVGRVA